MRLLTSPPVVASSAWALLTGLFIHSPTLATWLKLGREEGYIPEELDGFGPYQPSVLAAVIVAVLTTVIGLIRGTYRWSITPEGFNTYAEWQEYMNKVKAQPQPQPDTTSLPENKGYVIQSVATGADLIRGRRRLNEIREELKIAEDMLVELEKRANGLASTVELGAKVIKDNEIAVCELENELEKIKKEHRDNSTRLGELRTKLDAIRKTRAELKVEQAKLQIQIASA